MLDERELEKRERLGEGWPALDREGRTLDVNGLPIGRQAGYGPYPQRLQTMTFAEVFPNMAMTLALWQKRTAMRNGCGPEIANCLCEVQDLRERTR